MADPVWTFEGTDGELLVHTDVTGSAAWLGHRLTLAMPDWQASLHWRGGEPAAIRVQVAVASLQVRRGAGGLGPLVGPQKTLLRARALAALRAGEFPEIAYTADRITAQTDGYRLDGTLSLGGRSRRHPIDVAAGDLGDFWAMTARTSISQTAFGMRPPVTLMGLVKVADTVTVSFGATRLKDIPETPGG
ncbi:YceI family protein [Mycolicibacillus parakoreensis]|uniref:YceI family protein n=1 Tax=Mycolicibacillus parakoreensis TaxID=1069221 RepID=A0ABY3U9S9_9MYCO|nr:YceI family protein [Mycolicibacillus parakoreensis]MCV7317506.1 YceI family protein [Mycolicibacillus parakoreensis]ULN54223.1 YceI family protein [Mycolicibacillus parakoreensis]